MSEAVTTKFPVVVSGEYLPGIEYKTLFSRILCDSTSQCPALLASRDVSLEMEDLWMVRSSPKSSYYNCRLDSKDTAQHEIGKTENTIVVDMTVRDGRDVAGLFKISQAIKSCEIICCTGPYVLPTFSTASITEIVSEMVLEINHGVSVLSDKGEKLCIKAGAISVSLSSCEESVGKEDLKALEAAARAQALLLARNGGAPPICIELPPFSTLHDEVLTQLLRCGAEDCRIILCGNVLSLSSVDYFSRILESFSSSLLCVDSCGTVETPPSGAMYPHDAEIVQALKILIDRGHSGRIIVSVHVRYKMDLCGYGGNGYGHIERSVVPRMLEMGVSRDHIDEMTARNATRLLAWFCPPQNKEVEVDTLQCYICGTSFVPGEHYEKFDFVYCSSKCLQTHRKRNWTNL